MERNYKKLITGIFYVMLAAISCWATTESIHLRLSSWPKVFCWSVSIIFFVVASYGTKLITDAFNPRIYINHRWGRFLGGLVIILAFWLAFSFPTNTHTFFYRNIIGTEVRNDIATTKGYLAQIKNNDKEKRRIQLQKEKLENEVEILLKDLEAEIMNEANPGFGPKSKEILHQFDSLLHVTKINPLSYKATSVGERRKLCDAYRQKIYALKETRKNVIDATMQKPVQAMKDADLAYKNLSIVSESIESGNVSLYHADDINNVVRNRISDGYNTIGRHKLHVTFNTPEDEEHYTKPNPVTRIDGLLSVFDVWKDYLAKKYAGRGFIFWIFLSLLVDIGAFILFDLTFKKTE